MFFHPTFLGALNSALSHILHAIAILNIGMRCTEMAIQQLFTCPQQTAIAPDQALPPKPQPYRIQPRDIHGSSVLIQGQREWGVQILTRRAGLEALAMVLPCMKFVSPQEVQWKQETTSQGSLHSNVQVFQMFFQLIATSAQSRSVKVILPIRLSGLGSPTQGPATCLWHGKIMQKDVGDSFSCLWFFFLLLPLYFCPVGEENDI